MKKTICRSMKDILIDSNNKNKSLFSQVLLAQNIVSDISISQSKYKFSDKALPTVENR